MFEALLKALSVASVAIVTSFGTMALYEFFGIMPVLVILAVIFLALVYEFKCEGGDQDDR